MRLIDADALITKVCEWGTSLERGRKLTITMCEAKQAIVDIIEDEPTVDAVPVVRCRECRYSREPNRAFRDESVACDGVLVCCAGFDNVHPTSDDGVIFVDADGFCSDGKRREDGDGDVV